MLIWNIGDDSSMISYILSQLHLVKHANNITNQDIVFYTYIFKALLLCEYYSSSFL